MKFSELQIQEYQDNTWVNVGSNIETLSDARDEKVMLECLTDGKLRIVRLSTIINPDTEKIEEEVEVLK